MSAQGRHRDALAIQEGACNPSAIALAIVEACEEARAADTNPARDPAVRLMVHQLAFICQADDHHMGLDEYGRLRDMCRAGLARTTATPPPQLFAPRPGGAETEETA